MPERPDDEQHLDREPPRDETEEQEQDAHMREAAGAAEPE